MKVKRHRKEAAKSGQESGDNHARRKDRSDFSIYTIVPSTNTGRLVVTLRRLRVHGSSRMASPDSTVDTMGDVINISRLRKARGGLASHGRHHRARNGGCPYARNSERSGRREAKDELERSLVVERSSSLLPVGQNLPAKMMIKKRFLLSAGTGRDDLNEPKSMQGLVADQDGNGERHGDLAQKRQDETESSDLNEMQAGSSLLKEDAKLNSDCLDKEVGCTSTSVDYDATIDDDDDDE